MCRSNSDRGGPRRCAGDTRTAYHRACRTTTRLEQTQAALEADVLNGTAAIPFTMPLPAGVEPALQTAGTVGNALIVGGAVRDGLLGLAPKDIDIEVHDTDIDTLTDCYRRAGFQVDEVGRQFGVLKISKPGIVADLDVSVPRRDSKTAAGHRGFTVDLDTEMTLEEAAARRDFTVNAMFYDPRRHVVLDPFSGTEDLRTRTLRHVSGQFAEDPLRVLRAAQLAGRFAMTLEPRTAALCRDLLPHFDELPVERTREEWSKLYAKSRRPDMALKALQDSGWHATLPGLPAALADTRTVNAFTAVAAMPARDRMPIGAAILASTMSVEDRRTFLYQTVTGTAAARIAADLIDTRAAALDSSYARRRYAAQTAQRGFTFGRYLTYTRALGDRANLQVARAAVADGLGPGPQTPMIQGRDVLAASGRSKKAGPWVGELVAEALDRQHRGEFPRRSDALCWLSSNFPG
jgi:tRNA nucleotidyltransferase/poly(A) polymerase